MLQLFCNELMTSATNGSQWYLLYVRSPLSRTQLPYSFSSGDKVLMFPLPECRECIYCLHPRGNFCKKEKLVSILISFAFLGIEVDSILIMSFHFSSSLLCLGRSILSPTGLMLDGTSRFTCRGKKICHLYGTRPFTEYTVVDEIAVAKIDDTTPVDKVCVISCEVPTGFGAVSNTAQVRTHF